MEEWEINQYQTNKWQMLEDWNYTSEDSQTFPCTFDSSTIDNSWVPKSIKIGIVECIKKVLNTSGACYGVNVDDFYHGHVGIKSSDFSNSIASLYDKYFIVRNKLYENYLDYVQPIPESNFQEYAKAIEKLYTYAKDLLNEVVNIQKGVLIFHTLEHIYSNFGLLPGDALRNWKYTLGTSTLESFEPPDKYNASSWLTIYDGPPLFSFCFLIDKDGLIHIRPYMGYRQEFYTITGKMYDYKFSG